MATRQGLTRDLSRLPLIVADICPTHLELAGAPTIRLLSRWE
jgi:hypothetical protein